MPVVLQPSPDTRRTGRPEPLRRKREPAAAPAARRRWVRYALAFVTLVLVVDALAGDGGLMDRLRARREYRELARSLEDLRQENATLRHDIKRYRDDPAAIESLARQELGLMKPGEVLVIIKDARPALAPRPVR
jgi:cell division protein FtsB